MREIKFRVWDEKKNCWIKDYIQYCPETNLVKQGHTIQQFTGLQDKNGKDIYEGDFIRYDFPERGENIVLIRWTEEDEDNHPGFRIINLWGQGGKCEIIGNIFENPELLTNK